MKKFKEWIEQEEINERSLLKFARKAATGAMLAYQAFAGGDPIQAGATIGMKVPPNIQAQADVNAQGEAEEAEKKKRFATSNLRRMMKK